MPGLLQQAREMGTRALREEEGGLCEVGGADCGAEAEFEEGGRSCPFTWGRSEGWGGGREGIRLVLGWGGHVVWKRGTGDVEEGDRCGGDMGGCDAMILAVEADGNERKSSVASEEH